MPTLPSSVVSTLKTLLLPYRRIVLIVVSHLVPFLLLHGIIALRLQFLHHLIGIARLRAHFILLIRSLVILSIFDLVLMRTIHIKVLVIGVASQIR